MGPNWDRDNQDGRGLTAGGEEFAEKGRVYPENGLVGQHTKEKIIQNYVCNNILEKHKNRSGLCIPTTRIPTNIPQCERLIQLSK